MDLINDWPAITQHFRRCFQTNMHVAVASVSEQNAPTVTPIGSLFLNPDQSGFYFEKYTRSLPVNASIHPQICILAVNSSKWYWLQSLWRGRFATYPAVKLYGKMGMRRKATPLELRALTKRLRWTSRLQGHQYLWGQMQYIREIRFTNAEMIQLGKMTVHL